MGLISREVPVDHPDFGRAFPCICQREKLAEKRFENLRKKSSLHIYGDKRFDNFQTQLSELNTEQNRVLTIAADMAYRFAQHPEGWLFLRGGYGGGKTHLAAAIGNLQLELGNAVIFYTAPDLLDYLRSAYAPDSDVTYDALFDELRNTPLLILDDLGAESPTAWANEKLYQLFNYRYAHRLPMVITTNHEIEQIDARIASRLLDGMLTRSVHMDLPDYRRVESQSKSDLSDLRLYNKLTFETFDLRTYLPEEQSVNLRRVLQASQNFALNPEGWFILMGAHGCGKTHLAAAIANYMQSQLRPVVWVNVGSLADRLRETFNPQSKITYEKRFDEIRTAPLLVLDHFQLDTIKEWSREKLFQLVDYRYLAELPTIITKYGDTLEDLPKSFQSRLADQRLCSVFYIKAPDYRGGSGTHVKRPAR